MPVDATVVAEASVVATAFAAYLGFLGVRRGSQETTTKDRLIAEEKRYDECDKQRREDAEKHATSMDTLRAALDVVKADRDRERQRGDMLAVELSQYKVGMIGGGEKPPPPKSS